MAVRLVLVVILAVALIVLADECEALAYCSSSVGADQRSLIDSGSTHQQREQVCGEEARTRTAVGERREVGRQVEFPDVGEFEQRGEADKGRASMATAIKSWPDLVGLDVEEAKKKILEEYPDLQVQIVPEGNFMTMDFNLGRVRIHKNNEQKVARTPKNG